MDGRKAKLIVNYTEELFNGIRDNLQTIIKSINENNGNMTEDKITALDYMFEALDLRIDHVDDFYNKYNFLWKKEMKNTYSKMMKAVCNIRERIHPEINYTMD